MHCTTCSFESIQVFLGGLVYEMQCNIILVGSMDHGKGRYEMIRDLRDVDMAKDEESHLNRSIDK